MTHPTLSCAINTNGCITQSNFSSHVSTFSELCCKNVIYTNLISFVEKCSSFFIQIMGSPSPLSLNFILFYFIWTHYRGGVELVELLLTSLLQSLMEVLCEQGTKICSKCTSSLIYTHDTDKNISRWLIPRVELDAMLYFSLRVDAHCSSHWYLWEK